MAKTPYMIRVCDEVLDLELSAAGAVLIEGPKWCGKSRTAEQKAKSAVYMQDSKTAASYRKTALTMPSLLLDGETPHLIDEWQVAPVLWDAVRFAVDALDGDIPPMQCVNSSFDITFPLNHIAVFAQNNRPHLSTSFFDRSIISRFKLH